MLPLLHFLPLNIILFFFTIVLSLSALLPSMKSIPRATVRKAIALMEDGVSIRETAKRLKISKSAAGRIHTQDKEDMEDHKGGHPRKLPAETVEHLKVNLKRGILRTAVEARNEANQLLE